MQYSTVSHGIVLVWYGNGTGNGGDAHAGGHGHGNSSGNGMVWYGTAVWAGRVWRVWYKVWYVV